MVHDVFGGQAGIISKEATKKTAMAVVDELLGDVDSYHGLLDVVLPGECVQNVVGDSSVVPEVFPDLVEYLHIHCIEGND